MSVTSMLDTVVPDKTHHDAAIKPRTLQSDIR